MFCTKCGAQINEEAVICPKCGCGTANYCGMTSMNTGMIPITNNNETDTASAGGVIASILLPLGGFVLAINAFCNNKPKSGGAYLSISLVCTVIYSVLFF